MIIPDDLTLCSKFPDSDLLRRLPQQSRSQQRVTQILEAAAQVFAEVGYEAASTSLIATQAKTSVGSLYRFFPAHIPHSELSHSE